MRKMFAVFTVLMSFGLKAESQQTISATATASIVNPIGTSLETIGSTTANDIVLYHKDVNNGWKIQQVKSDNNQSAPTSKLIHIANLQVLGSNSAMYSIVLPAQLTIRNNETNSSLQMRCVATQQLKAETVMIYAAVLLPPNKLLGTYTPDEALTIMVNFN